MPFSQGRHIWVGNPAALQSCRTQPSPGGAGPSSGSTPYPGSPSQGRGLTDWALQPLYSWGIPHSKAPALSPTSPSTPQPHGSAPAAFTGTSVSRGSREPPGTFCPTWIGSHWPVPLALTLLPLVWLGTPLSDRALAELALCGRAQPLSLPSIPHTRAHPPTLGRIHTAPFSPSLYPTVRTGSCLETDAPAAW